MNILFIGDVVGKPGRDVTKYFLDRYASDLDVDFVIANLENASHGKGLIRSHFLEMMDAGVDVVTLGNHYLAKKEILDFIDDYDNIVRPLNVHHSVPGKGTQIFNVDDLKIRVTNLLGRVFMENNPSNPFDALEDLIKDDDSDIHIVDFHGEATGEKQAFGFAFDGKVSAVLGTHTHVQTNDLRKLPNGTFYISDVGMCGPNNGILGSKKEEVIKRTWTGTPAIFSIDDEDPEMVFSAVLLTYDENKKKISEGKNIYKVFSREEVTKWLKM